ncbi:hypothetical protein [Streptomyces fagopyri]|uniref:hypothetical protein n=1 Tax=Streptomyces fagopyri TaxID=2662397 RepID=UPI001885A704|nr:hypothetical protein [Streptomyces fagopyri]
MAASTRNSVAATGLLDQVTSEHPGTARCGSTADAVSTSPSARPPLGIDLAITRRKPRTNGAMTDLMARRPTNENSVSCRDRTPQNKRKIQDETTREDDLCVT